MGQFGRKIPIAMRAYVESKFEIEGKNSQEIDNVQPRYKNQASKGKHNKNRWIKRKCLFANKTAVGEAQTSSCVKKRGKYIK